MRSASAASAPAFLHSAAALAEGEGPPTDEVVRRYAGRIVKIELQETGASASIGSGFFASAWGTWSPKIAWSWTR